MKTSTKITDITHEDLVDLFSTATYGSSWFTIKRPKGSYKGTKLENPEHCLEDTWAAIALNDGKLFFCDFYAEDEDEYYGTKNHKWTGEYMRYEINLDDIKTGIENALNTGGYEAKCAMRLIDNDDCSFDMNDADTLVQLIMFNGEIVYG